MMSKRLKFAWAAALCVAMTTLFSEGATAQQFPQRHINLVVPVAPGGLTDMVARLVGQRLSERLGQSVVVENRPGGGGVVAMKTVAKMPADGHSLVIVFPGSAAVTPVLSANPPYDTLRDFVPVARIAMYPMILVAKPTEGRDVKGWLAEARKKPGSLNYGSAGNTTSSHLAMELLKREAGVNIVHVPFKGESNALSELLAGRIDLMFSTLGPASAYIREGKIKPLGVATAQRSKFAPNVPTLAEAGLAGLDIPGWYGIMAPAGTPAPIVERLNREISAILAEKETIESLGKLGVQPWPSTTKELHDWIRKETDRWRMVVTQAGIKAD